MAITRSSVKTISGLANQLKAAPRYFSYGIRSISYNVTGLSTNDHGLMPDRRNMIRDVFKYYSNFLGIRFSEVKFSWKRNAINFTDRKPGASSTLGPNSLGQAFINISDNWDGGATAMGSYAWSTAVHEIGHSLGLGHGGHYNGFGVTWAGNAEYWNDTRLLTNMSYFNPNNGDRATDSREHSTITGSHINNATMMAADYYALRDVYSRVGHVDAHYGNTTLGFNTTISRSSDPVWSRLASHIAANRFFYTDKATGSYDTVDFRKFAQKQRIDLRVTTRGMTDAYWSNIGGEVKNLAFADHSVFDRAIAGSGDDVVIGNHVNNALYGMSGSDRLYGLKGQDRLYGHAGRDRLYGGNNDDYLHGGSDSDFLFGGSGHDRLIGSVGHDYLYGGSGNDKLYGGSGYDRLIGSAGRDYLHGGSGNDKLYGGSGYDRLIGSAGHDYLRGGSGNDKLYGGSGYDRLIGSAGHDYLHGGSGNDKLYGGSGYDLLVGSVGQDMIFGGSGVDRLYGGSSNDYLDGGSSGDVMHGGSGRDTFRIQQGSGYDRVLDFRNGQDRIFLGDGCARVWISSSYGDAYVWKGYDLLAKVDNAAGQLQLSGNYLV